MKFLLVLELLWSAPPENLADIAAPLKLTNCCFRDLADGAAELELRTALILRPLGFEWLIVVFICSKGWELIILTHNLPTRSR